MYHLCICHPQKFPTSTAQSLVVPPISHRPTMDSTSPPTHPFLDPDSHSPMLAVLSSHRRTPPPLPYPSSPQNPLATASTTLHPSTLSLFVIALGFVSAPSHQSTPLGAATS
uniref:Uncharacterized protein n=1 Tax=Lygus hesperus TaxID=30085 RepID=A0A0A9WGA8_LYGHE